MTARTNSPAVVTDPVFVTVSGNEINLTAIGATSDNPRYEVFLAGWAVGYESREGTVERLRWERDLWYFCYTNRKTPAEFYRHATNELWNEATR